MPDDITNLILEHLRHIRGRVDRVADDMGELKARLSSLETAMLIVKREVNAGDETDARLQVAVDKLAQRVERIEKRLDLID